MTTNQGASVSFRPETEHEIRRFTFHRRFYLSFEKNQEYAHTHKKKNWSGWLWRAKLKAQFPWCHSQIKLLFIKQFHENGAFTFIGMLASKAWWGPAERGEDAVVRLYFITVPHCGLYAKATNSYKNICCMYCRFLPSFLSVQCQVRMCRCLRVRKENIYIHKECILKNGVNQVNKSKKRPGNYNLQQSE